ncbi:hypothetical protein Tco_0262740, partial [Tanacetum coccineum]
DDKGFVNSGCSRYMTGNIAYLLDFKKFDGGYVSFGGGTYGGRITSKRTLKTDNLDFEDVYFVNELKFNLFSVSHIVTKRKRTHPNAQRNMVPRAVLMKTGLKPFNTARTVNTCNGYLRKGQNRSQNDKTEHEKGKSVKQKSNQSQKSKSQSQSQPKSTPTKSKSKPKP